MVRQGSAKPSFAGSIPAQASKKSIDIDFIMRFNTKDYERIKMPSGSRLRNQHRSQTVKKKDAVIFKKCKACIIGEVLEQLKSLK